uniref:Glucose-methanol-choline oxidoreductase N-terminal domain-containing protein n=1 Tax=Moniliophthora roreri TaxID=221103 RepID=A0A0W0FKS4_MONRR
MFRLLLGAATLICAAASPPFSKRAFGVTTDPSVANGQTFDFIVVGGGLTDDRGDSRVYDIYAYGQAFGTSLDWQWPTEHGTMVSGKTLGGSSSINGGHYTRGLAAQYDAWSTLLESSEAGVGWNWNGMFNYMKKSEGFSGPNGQQSDKGAQANDAYHGFNGPVQVTFPDAMYGGPQQPAFIDTITSLTGMTHCPDLNGGNPNYDELACC